MQQWVSVRVGGGGGEGCEKDNRGRELIINIISGHSSLCFVRVGVWSGGV